ncbi:conjugal transfer protein TraD [Sphingomonas sp. AOB5]|uniref:conjugal transfer protein TraD n=1 Tax=Sphingomonas sp. AOB5 TaxID=3034017 RepID=UPI0023F72958|nr:conjugal transfer protein TraD [Sphingomonas sp. AOB5]MDF7775697.1 conjugal transfer protein TraD [Sphingomonas sp. AOB5]
MRKPRDFDAELKALTDRAKHLKDRKLQQLGELVIATGADALPIEQLAGLLLAGVENKESNAKESWRKRGAAFFQRTARPGGSAGEHSGSAASGNGSAQSP